MKEKPLSYNKHSFNYFVLFLIISGCSSAAPPEPKRIVDLSPTRGENYAVERMGKAISQMFGYRSPTKFERNVFEGNIYITDTYLTLYNHMGVHHDPPNHIIKGGMSTDQFPLDRFFGKAKVLDYRDKPKDEPLMRSDFENKGIAADDIVIAFVGYDPPSGDEELPSYAYLSGEAAEYLASIPIKAFATDMPSTGSFHQYIKNAQAGIMGSENYLPEHYALLSKNIVNIEGLVNLESIVDEEYVVFVGFPLKIENGTGAPIRAAALVY